MNSGIGQSRYTLRMRWIGSRKIYAKSVFGVTVRDGGVDLEIKRVTQLKAIGIFGTQKGLTLLPPNSVALDSNGLRLL